MFSIFGSNKTNSNHPDSDIYGFKQKADILYKALSNPYKWYTGRPIRRFLQQEVFSLSQRFDNLSIQAGRWSAYCHYSRSYALSNLLSKLSINKQSKVLIHPLLPKNLVYTLVDSEANLFSRDIDKDTLQFQVPDLDAFLNQRNQDFPDIVVLYSNVGLYSSLKAVVETIQKYNIPTILIIDNNYLTSSLLDLFQYQRLGGVIWSYGENFWDKYLDEVLDEDLPAEPWFLSWFLENRALSDPEYHLYQSQDIFEELIEALYYLYLDKYYQGKPFAKWQKKIRLSSLKNRKIEHDSAKSLIKKNYRLVNQCAVPDVVFDLQSSIPKSYPNSNSELLGKQQDIQNLALRFHNFLKVRLPQEDKNTIEIPDLFLDQEYLDYFFYTTNLQSWSEEMVQKGYKVEPITELHPVIIDNPSLPIANFVAKYGLKIDLVHIYNNL